MSHRSADAEHSNSFTVHGTHAIEGGVTLNVIVAPVSACSVQYDLTRADIDNLMGLEFSARESKHYTIRD